MLTMICNLKFPDGKNVTAIVNAETPYDKNAVIYSGAVELLPRRHEKASPCLLQISFRNVAFETGATLTTHTKGEYDLAE